LHLARGETAAATAAAAAALAQARAVGYAAGTDRLAAIESVAADRRTGGVGVLHRDDVSGDPQPI
ncbi:hypothetical protein, partial [Pseudonocardia lacus]|uniref:hypothetical protein n=1 Tax=Pseudonocardia lacus TaxID=2835865 RepID=UPI001BDCEB22